MEKIKTITTKNASTNFLRLAVIAIGAIILALCIFALPAMWVHVDDEYPRHTYVFYTILSLMYVSSVPFFIALRYALRILRLIDTNRAFSNISVGAIMRIKQCAMLISVIYVAALPFFYIWGDNDDAPGVVVLGMILVGAPLVIAVFAAVVQRLLREAIAMKSENDLTV